MQAPSEARPNEGYTVARRASGRSLEPCGDTWSRQMIVHDRTRLIVLPDKLKKARIAFTNALCKCDTGFFMSFKSRSRDLARDSGQRQLILLFFTFVLGLTVSAAIHFSLLISEEEYLIETLFD